MLLTLAWTMPPQKLGNVKHATQDALTTDELRERLAG